MAGHRRANRPGSGWTKNEVENLLYAGFLGVFGRPYRLRAVYNLPVFLADPLYLFRVWDGGMSFHGGLIGVITVMIIFARRTKRTFFGLRFYRAADPVWSWRRASGQLYQRRAVGRVDPSFHYTMIFRAPVPKTWRCCRRIRNGNRCSIPTARCRVTRRSCTSWRWKAWYCS